MHEDFWGSFVEGVKIELGISHVCEDGKKERSRKEKKVHAKACGKREQSDVTRGTGSW